MTIHVTPIPRLIDLAAPSFTLGTANAAGSAVTAVASDATLLAFDTTLPDAITFGQSGAVGSSTTAARRSHAHAMESATPPGLVFGARDVTEFTTTSTSKVTAATLAIEVAADVPIYAFSGWRKTAGSANNTLVYIDLNTTQIFGMNAGSGTNQAENGMLAAWMGGRVTNYLKNAYANRSSSNAAAEVGPLAPTADMPTASITQLLFSTSTNNASQTAAMDESYVYSLATS